MAALCRAGQRPVWRLGSLEWRSRLEPLGLCFSLRVKRHTHNKLPTRSYKPNARWTLKEAVSEFGALGEGCLCEDMLCACVVREFFSPTFLTTSGEHLGFAGVHSGFGDSACWSGRVLSVC